MHTCYWSRYRGPRKDDDDDGNVDEGPEDEYGNPAGELDDEAGADGGQGVANSEADQHLGRHRDSEGAGR